MSTRLPNNPTPMSQVKTSGYRALPNSLLGNRTPPQSMMRCPCKSIGPQTPQCMPLFKWINSPKSETYTPSEEALVGGTSHVQCNPLMLSNDNTYVEHRSYAFLMNM
ncbi:hypothetical protein M9H77_16751 [Catharanthus roseus]|uniref:Uncharacterized protein n=1 Tax=Catharanthus roseus TaxID=4058 RepID=A0ACC0B2P3_CATRO|nr:hypothetical protein M9H77_16751 [Catharanthus roseus]